MLEFKGTTVIALKHNGKSVMGGDGQVTFGDTILKSSARKVRKIFDGKVVAGFAGSTADAFTLFDRFESKLQKYQGNLMRASVELAKDWRTDKILRRLEALLIVMDKDHMFIISGSGDVVEPEEGIAAIGSGGNYALSAAKALVRYSNLDAEEIVKESLRIASEICVYTNEKFVIESL